MQVVNMLQLLAKISSEPDAQAKLDNFIRHARKAQWHEWGKQCFGPRGVDDSAWSTRRVDHHSISVIAGSTREATPIEEFGREHHEVHPHRVSRGTKNAMTRGVKKHEDAMSAASKKP